MDRLFIATLTIAAAALALTGEGSVLAEGGRGGGSANRIYRMHRVSVPKPSMPSRGVSGQGRSSFPERDESGARISKPAATMAPSHHAGIVANEGLVHGIQARERLEATPNHYYWHNEGGIRYSHYYDGHVHWYGFYHGPTFYWTRYYGNRWWWYGGGRWLFWWDGFWWWPGVAGVPYVYIDGSYYPYESPEVTVQHEESLPPPTSIPPANPGAANKSPDGRRMVQVIGSEGQAFLYDSTVSPPKFEKFLGADVDKVRFTGGTADAPLQILVEYRDRTFALFDADGNSQSSAVKTTESKAAAPAVPDSMPPPPTSAPGQ
jgi:hypothetical protein